MATEAKRSIPTVKKRL